MMRGVTIRRQATMPITFRLPGQPDFTLEFVVDTGFNGSLTLPIAAVRAMSLPVEQDLSSSLADGSFIQMTLHSALILWNGSEQQVGVVATGRRPLVGTELLDEQELRVRFHEGDLVSVQDL